ncbi:TBC1 domain family member 7 isoform X2 [Cephus cinctus]|uniref:TBC1 domain family member 7 n=1 Tax=Cephus cinctus TaxID=211228 RepID=A0AAJ7C0H8_CEPCN|nr:TBC1 domain family member 7 isoform X2 [Cephus cinctus]
MADERNFRSSYYEKVGFRSVEERKSLEILLKDRPFDKAKLKQFCLRFTVPTLYRNFLWKILLGVVPTFAESHDFIMIQRKAEFEDLQKALQIAKIVNENTKPHEVFLTMWLLRTRRVKIDLNAQLDAPLLRLSHKFLILYLATSKLAESLCHVVDTDHEDKLVDTYWLLRGFLDQVQKFYKEVVRLQECTYNILEREDPDLYKHLTKIEALFNLPFHIWFYSCFAGTISNGSIPKIWDKIVVGAYKILVFVAVVTLITLKRVLLRCEHLDNILDAINNISEETSEVIVNKAIELWQQSGSTLVSMPQSIQAVAQVNQS